MHILIVPSAYPNVYNPLKGIFYKEQAEALSKNGHKVTVAFPEMWSIKNVVRKREHSGIVSHCENGVLTYRYNGYNYFPKLYRATSYLFYRRLKDLYNRITDEVGKPDIVHAHSSFWAGHAASFLCGKEGLPFVVTEHSSAIGMDTVPRFHRRALTDVMLRTRKAISVGPGLLRALQPYAPAHKLVLIPNLIDVEKFGSLSVSNKMKERFRFFSLANLGFNKGMDVLLKAAKKVSELKDFELVIGGTGEELDNLQRMVTELGLSDHVFFPGKLLRDQVRKEMGACDSFILTSRYETFGVVYIEALASGKPIIATKCGGPEMIVNKNNGFLVTVDDVDETALTMIEMMEQYHRFQPKQIRDDCIDRFSEGAVVKQLTDLYAKVLEEWK